MMKTAKRSFRLKQLWQPLVLMLSILTMVGMMGCTASTDAQEQEMVRLKAPINMLPANSTAAEIVAFRHQLLRDMHNAKIEFKRLGRVGKLYFSTDAVFVGKTANLLSRSTDTQFLKRLQMFLSTYDIDSMTITSYRIANESPAIDQALANQQANLIERKLAHKLTHIHQPRFIRAKGVVWPAETDFGDHIEIAFQFYPRKG